jgi:hypothetical protein
MEIVPGSFDGRYPELESFAFSRAGLYRSHYPKFILFY